MTDKRTEVVDVLGGSIGMRVVVAGAGDPLVYLHSAGGLHWDGFLDDLASRYTVYAPYFPGTHPDEPQAIESIDTLWDAVLAYDDLLDALGVGPFRLVGHSFGGMLACELAAQRRNDVTKMVVISPIGLWLEDEPYTCATYTAVPPEELPNVLFHRLEADAVKKSLELPVEPELVVEAQVQLVWTLACTGKTIWPIPDKGLAKRMHRVTAPTLVIWGEKDALISCAYAKEFGRRLPDSEVLILSDVGHCPALEDPERVIEHVEKFLL